MVDSASLSAISTTGRLTSTQRSGLPLPPNKRLGACGPIHFRPMAERVDQLPQAQAAYRAPPFGKKLGLTTNLLACFSGPIYFVKGMWRKGLVLPAAAS